MLAMPQTYRRYAYPLATGQTTSYGSGTGVDDGALQRGIAKPTEVYAVLTAGQYSGTTNIVLNGKTDAHTNNCVYDTNTRLMWSKDCVGSVGPNSNGTLPWTTNVNGEGIFPYVAAANAANLSGYSDWRIPNRFELDTLLDNQPPGSYPNPTVFGVTWESNYVWTSSVVTNNTANNIAIGFSFGTIPSGLVKTNNYLCALVRGGW